MIITYHEIVREQSPYLYAVSAERLREHLAFLRQRNGGNGPEVGVTFDDGLSSHRHPAADLLEEGGVRGTFFVTPKLIGTRGYMDVGEVRGLLENGHDVQSHGWSHALLPLCRPAELYLELKRSKVVLEDWLGRAVDAIAVPGGAYSPAVLRVAAETGYSRVYTSDAWLQPTGRYGVRVIGRLMIRNSTTVDKLDALLATESRRFSLPRVAQFSRRIARATLGMSLYHGLWRLAAGERHKQYGHGR